MDYPLKLKKLAKRLYKEAMKLFPDDDAKQEEWFLDQFKEQFPGTKDLKLERTLIATLLKKATQDAYEAFPDDQERAVVRILELMDWDNVQETRDTAHKALNMFRTDPLFAEDKAIRQ